MQSLSDDIAPPSPFAAQDEAAYRAWRERKLGDAVLGRDLPPIPIQDATAPDANEIEAIQDACRLNNFARIRFVAPPAGPLAALTRLSSALGLNRFDHHLCSDPSGFSRLSARETATDNDYIPYSRRRLNWHTDGYYHSPARRIRAWLLYCASDAARGGDNILLDHEIAYLRLRDADPDLAAALLAPDAMTIPANIERGGTLVRPAQTGPVFSVVAHDRLHMRYTARRRYIEWKDDPATRAAADFLSALLEDGDEFMVRLRHEPGEALISNNVLHCRTAFSDDEAAGKSRLLYRARFFDPVDGT